MSRIELTWSKLIPLKKVNVEELNSSGGVYRLSKKSEDGNYYVFFVGSAENIKEKLLLHLSKDEENIRLAKFLEQGGEFVFRYAIISERSTQEAVEKQLYKTYLPEYNLGEPSSALEVEANLI